MKPAASRVLIYPARKAESPGMAYAIAALQEMEPATKQWRGIGWGRLWGVLAAGVGFFTIPAIFAVLYYGVYPLERKQNPPIMILTPDQIASQETPAAPTPTP
ncbi:hypothetical protein [Niveispirillum irakense]|uniref:hypothetical protein n=1 Tax=Niveispirillum irakense TaxID=34011 RepID=UPI0004188745|nr:hypothetical protein [Niveispirillum irakense]